MAVVAKAMIMLGLEYHLQCFRKVTLQVAAHLQSKMLVTVTGAEHAAELITGSARTCHV